LNTAGEPLRILVRARNCTLGVEGARLVAPEGRFDIVIRAPHADLRPGLINAHDHLHRHHYGRLGEPPYADAIDWAEDVQRRYRGHIADCRARVGRREALLRGAWRNLFAGVTTVVHHDPWEEDFEHGFPIRVARIVARHSLAMSQDTAVLAHEKGPVMLHVAEGIDERAASELDQLGELRLLGENFLAVHCVGVRDQDTERLRNTGSALVWCPTSNHFLFGQTAPRGLFEEGGDVLLGSDSPLTAQGDLLDELRAARETGLLDDRRLEMAVGSVAARRLGLSEPSLEPGAHADVILLAAPLLEANRDHVRLVIAGGVPRVAAPEIARQLGEALPGVNRLPSGGAAYQIGRPIEQTDRKSLCA